MTNQHRATTEQWEELQTVSQSILKMHAPHSCILELRARVEALEARPAAAPAPADSLVERVASRLRDLTGADDDAIDLWHDEARAAIREVAEWLSEGRGDSGAWCTAAADLIKEVNR